MKIIVRAPGPGFGRVMIHFLFFFAVLCLLASLLTAPGQLYLGKLYYAKDAGVLVSYFILAALAARRNDKLAMLLAAVATGLILLFVPALRTDESASTGLNIMWIMKWTVAVQLGILTYRERLQRALPYVLAGLLAILCVDAIIGSWEIGTQGYFFEMSESDETAAGVAMVKQEHVGGLIRVLALHRSGTDFGNSMATGIMVCGFLLMVCRKLWIRLTLAPLLALCAFDLFFSTLRSFLVGATASMAALIWHLLMPRALNRFSAHIIAGLIVVCLFFSYFNIIPAVEFVSKHVLNDSDIGNVESSYMRLDTWDNVFRDIKDTPAVAIIGGPLASALSLNAPPSNICDNIYLWFFYHTGIFGLIVFLVCVPLPLLARTDARLRAFYFATTAQLLVTGIFTDSLFFFSALVTFFTLGLMLAELDTRRIPAFVQFKFAPARARQGLPGSG